jgi:hypothetical protein
MWWLPVLELLLLFGYRREVVPVVGILFLFGHWNQTDVVASCYWGTFVFGYRRESSVYPCKLVLLLQPIKRLSLFLSKFVPLGQKYSLMILSNIKRQHMEREYWKNGFILMG